jgi:hypothetical protein
VPPDPPFLVTFVIADRRHRGDQEEMIPFWGKLLTWPPQFGIKELLYVLSMWLESSAFVTTKTEILLSVLFFQFRASGREIRNFSLILYISFSFTGSIHFAEVH